MNIIFIGKDKPTNQAISRRLNEQLNCAIHFVQHPDAVAAHIPSVPFTPDLVIYDTDSYTGNIVSRIRELSREFTPTPLLVLHSYKKYKLAEPLIENGASGVISSSPREEDLLASVKTLLSGSTYIQEYDNT